VNIAGSSKSLKSASSSDRFKSAVDEQEPDKEMIREIEGVLHAFRTALEVLGKVMKQIDEQDKTLRIEAEKLDYSLTKGLDIKQAHGSHHKKHGKAYLSALLNSQRTVRQLQLIVANLMGDLVTTLHMYSAAYLRFFLQQAFKSYTHAQRNAESGHSSSLIDLQCYFSRSH
jgi:hypothetical protein